MPRTECSLEILALSLRTIRQTAELIDRFTKKRRHFSKTAAAMSRVQVLKRDTRRFGSQFVAISRRNPNSFFCHYRSTFAMRTRVQQSVLTHRSSRNAFGNNILQTTLPLTIIEFVVLRESIEIRCHVSFSAQAMMFFTGLQFRLHRWVGDVAPTCVPHPAAVSTEPLSNVDSSLFADTSTPRSNPRAALGDRPYQE